MNCTRIALLAVPQVAAALSGNLCRQPEPHAAPAPPPPESSTSSDAKPFKQPIPAAAYSLDMLPIPGDPSKNIKPFYLSKTEVTWEAFDVFVYRLDQPADTGAPQSTSTQTPDAVSRPSKPYIPPDRGFGHEGYAAIGMSHHSAATFCTWLSAKSGRHYRLPTEAEWEHACLAGAKGPLPFDDAAKLPDHAWCESNAADTTHPVAKKLPNPWGLHDMLGNAAEWCDTADGKGVVRGGSYLDSADDIRPTTRQPNDPAWNAADPQVPKSKWWLASATHIGFRIVCDSPDATPTSKPDATETSKDANRANPPPSMP